MTDHKVYAKRLLVHYFQLLAEKCEVNLDSDCISEIESIVDSIIAATIEQENEK